MQGPAGGVSSGPPAGEGARLCPDGTPQALVFEFMLFFHVIQYSFSDSFHLKLKTILGLRAVKNR